jgi:hypothetical protein
VQEGTFACGKTNVPHTATPVCAVPPDPLQFCASAVIEKIINSKVKKRRFS